MLVAAGASVAVISFEDKARVACAASGPRHRKARIGPVGRAAQRRSAQGMCRLEVGRQDDIACCVSPPPPTLGTKCEGPSLGEFEGGRSGALEEKEPEARGGGAQKNRQESASQGSRPGPSALTAHLCSCGRGRGCRLSRCSPHSRAYLYCNPTLAEVGPIQQPRLDLHQTKLIVAAPSLAGSSPVVSKPARIWSRPPLHRSKPAHVSSKPA